MEQYLTPAEVCDIIRCSRRFVYDLLTSGRIKAHRPSGRWLITTAAVQAYVEADHPGPGRPRKPTDLDSQQLQSRELAAYIERLRVDDADRAERQQRHRVAAQAPIVVPAPRGVAATAQRPNPLANRKQKQKRQA